MLVLAKSNLTLHKNGCGRNLKNAICKMSNHLALTGSTLRCTHYDIDLQCVGGETMV